MSKIGKKVLMLPSGVELKVQDSVVSVKGPKGQLQYKILPGVHVNTEGSEAHVSVDSEEIRNLWGLTRTLISNMIHGVTDGYEKKLHVMGVGYNVKLQGTTLNFNLGFAHPVNFPLPKGIEAKLDKNSKGDDIISISGIDKHLVGEIAAKLKELKKPEPYKGKGIRYFGEEIKLKAGKAAKK